MFYSEEMTVSVTLNLDYGHGNSYTLSNINRYRSITRLQTIRNWFLCLYYVL